MWIYLTYMHIYVSRRIYKHIIQQVLDNQHSTVYLDREKTFEYLMPILFSYSKYSLTVITQKLTRNFDKDFCTSIYR